MKEKLQQAAYSEFIFVLRQRKLDGRKQHPIFVFGLFYKSAKICFYCECTQIKANLLQFRLSSWLKGVFASIIRRKKNQVIASVPYARTQLSILPWQCSLFIIIKKTISHTYGKIHTAQFKYVVKSVPLSVITVLPWSYAKHLVLCGYWSVSEVGLHKR